MKRPYLTVVISFLGCYLLFAPNSIAQYLETFSTPNKGILAGSCSGTEASCMSDFSGVDWTINGDFSGMDGDDFFATDGSGRLNGDGDNDAGAPGLCFETPVLNISGAVGTVSFTMDLEWVSWDFTDIANVEYQVDGGSWTQVPPLPGTSGPGTVDFNSDGNSGSGMAGASGISGNTLSIRVCLQSNSSFDDLFIDNVSVPAATLAPLPVELTSFSAAQSEGHVQLDWSTASETNNDRFEIEESTDGRTFKKIGNVLGKGTTSEAQAYSFTVDQPHNGISYFRLKQIDLDGLHTYSKVVSINFLGRSEQVGIVYPNPSKNGLVNLAYTSKEEDEIEVSVFDIMGRQVAHQMQEVSKGYNNLSFDFSNLNQGTYTLGLRVKRNSSYQKLMIHR